MAEKLVPTVRTPVTMQSYARALAHAWRHLIGSLPTKGQAGVLWAQYGIETGAGPWCWNYNIGNVKKVTGDGHDYMMLANTWEIIGGKRVVFQPPHPATWFRAFPDLDTAMIDHLRFLRGKRYAAAWEGVELGDCGVFARLLKKAGYYTADANAYATGMLAHFNRWMKANAFEDAVAELSAESDGPIRESSVITPSSADANAATVDFASFVPVDHGGVTWLVCPIYIAPIGIGQAADLAAQLGCELPSPGLVDAIWRAADLRVPPHLMIRSHDDTPATMNSPAIHARQVAEIEAFVGNRSLGRDFRLLAGAYKDVVRHTGKVGLYGWHVDDQDPVQVAGIKRVGVPLSAPATPGPGRVVQPFFAGHSLAWQDYSQACRLVRRAS